MADKTLKNLQRVIFPSAVETDVVPLYVDASVATGVQLPTRIDGDASTSIAEAMNTSGQSVSNASANRDAANSLNSRRSITVTRARACLSVRTSTRSPPRTGAAGLTCRRSC